MNFKVSEDGKHVSFENSAGDHLYEIELVPDESPLLDGKGYVHGDTLIIIGPEGSQHLVPLPPEALALLRFA